MDSAQARRVTLQDVAQLAGVSRTTAAKALLGTGGAHVRVGPQTLARVTAAAETLQYRPNRSAQHLAGASTRLFGILMDTVNAPVMNDRLAAIEEEAAQRGYRLLIGQLHNRVGLLRDYLNDFDSHGVAATFCLFDLTLERNTRLGPILGAREDFVYHGMPLREGGRCVRVDTAKAIRLLVDHLWESGYRRIGLALSNPDDVLMEARRDAYRAVLAVHGVDVERIWQPESGCSPVPVEQADEAVTALVTGQDADAILASNDVWAVRLIQVLKQRGIRIPQEVAVSGYDNLALSTVIDPALTTIDQNHALYARAALDLLVEAADRKPAGAGGRRGTVTIDPRLVVRASTAITGQG